MTIWEAVNSMGVLALVVLAFSVLIFVHELGHFLAAVAVGVRVERFFIGFDIYGWALKFKHKGVVYGIGALPLGGYVKLAGQSDDPRAEEITGAPDELRSKPLWAQALVFVAGVAMNMVFGFLLLLFAYFWGFPEPPAVIGSVMAGMPAEAVGLQPGDRITHIEGHPVDRFREMEMTFAINPRAWHTVTFERPGETEPRSVQLRGMLDPGDNLHRIGAWPMVTTRIGDFSGDRLMPYLPAIRQVLKKGDRIVSVNGIDFPNEDYDGTRVEGVFAGLPGTRAVKVEILRDRGKKGREADYEPVTVSVPVPATSPRYDLGYRVEVRIDRVQTGSAAREAGLSSGDRVTAIHLPDGTRRDFLERGQFFDLIREAGFQPVALTFVRDGEEKTVTVTPRFMGFDPRIPQGGDTLLGLAAEAEADGFRVGEVHEDGPAAGLLQPGDLLTAAGDVSLAEIASFVKALQEPEAARGEIRAAAREAGVERMLSLGDAIARACTQELRFEIAGQADRIPIRPRINLENGVPQIGAVISARQVIVEVLPGTLADTHDIEPGSQVFGVFLSPDRSEMILAYRTPRQEPVTLAFPAPEDVQRDPAAHGFIGYTGIQFKPYERMLRYGSPMVALGAAGRDTLEMSLMVYTMIHRLVTGQLEMKVTAGPIGVMDFLFRTARTEHGFIDTLRLIALISINLAVFNLLPFFVLDGGHLLFLLVEWIKGSPPHMKLREYTQYFGLVCLLALAVYVTTNDIGRLVDQHGGPRPFDFSAVERTE